MDTLLRLIIDLEFIGIIIMVCAFVCIALESKKTRKMRIVFWLVFAMGVFFTIQAGRMLF